MTNEIHSLFSLALIVAVVARTVTQEEVMRELREFCARQSKHGPLPKRKLCYLFTCQYCFSHYVALGVVLLTGFRFWTTGFWGVVFAMFALVAVANLYMAAYERLTVATREARVRIAERERK